MDDDSSSDLVSSDADDDSAVSVTALSGLSQYSSGRDESASETLSRPLKRKRCTGVSSPVDHRWKSKMPAHGNGSAPSRADSINRSSSGTLFPSWLRNLVKDPLGPSVALAYHELSDKNGNKQLWIVPLRCVFPANFTPTQPGPTIGERSGMYNELPLYFESENPRASKTCPDQASCKNPADQELRSLFARKLHAAETSIASPDLGSQNQPASMDPLGIKNLPVETFDHIGLYISNKDVKNLRLTCKAIEKMVSRSLFHTVVVPFTTEVYGLLSSGAEGTQMGDHCAIVATKDQLPGPTISSPIHDDKPESKLMSGNPSANHGVNVFRGFGGYIHRFGMSFEIDHKSLADPPWKALTGPQSTYWGRYMWPFPEYQRFSKTACLEDAADETSTMTLAFSHLTDVKHLAISVDSGLGWMSGPDLSMRARILQQPSRVFGSPRYLPQTDLLGSRTIWNVIEESYESIGEIEQLKFMELGKDQRESAADVVQSNGWRDWIRVKPDLVSDTTTAVDTTLATLSSAKIRALCNRPRIDYRLGIIVPQVDPLPADEVDLFGALADSEQAETNNVVDSDEADLNQNLQEDLTRKDTNSAVDANQKPNSPTGILFTKKMKNDPDFSTQKPRAHEIWPKHLKRTQKEWLLETAWAQDAFISSYLLAVADNQATFSNVTELTMSSISSRYLPKLHRDDFWSALTALARVEIIVSADWRDIVKEHNDYLATPAISPSDSVNAFSVLVSSTIAFKSSVKALTVGWKDGGEHAEGLCARNKKILPAPIGPRESMLKERFSSKDCFLLPHVEHLTLRNCWLTPNALVNLVNNHKKTLKNLTLESFSLTAHPAIPARHGNLGGGGAGGGGVAGALFGAANHGAAANINQQMANPAHNLPQAIPVLWHQVMALPFGQLALNAYHAMVPVGVTITNAVIQHNNLIAAGHGWPYGPGQGPVPGLGYVSTTQLHQFHIQIHALIQQIHAYLHAPGNTNHQAQAQMVPAARRRGCWPAVLDEIKSICTQADNLDMQLSFLSCGYAKLRNATFDQSALLEAYQLRRFPYQMTDFFKKRRAALEEHMLGSNDEYLARISSAIPQSEREDLTTQWTMRDGWPLPDLAGPDYDNEGGWGKWGRRNETAAFMDGQPRGGTGRFSGRIDGFELPADDDE